MPASEYFEVLPEDFSDQAQFKTDLSTFDNGKEQRRSRWASNRISYGFSFPNAVDEQIDEIWDFYVDRKGSWESFYLAVPPGQTHWENVSGAGSVTLSAATKPSPLNITVYITGALYSDWTYSEDTKQITFGSNQTGMVHVDFYEMALVRFAEDIYSRNWMLYLVTSQSLNFITV
jgi:hypothetical protein